MMKIIDINLSVGGWDAVGQVVDLQRLLAVMEDYRIDHGVCYHQHALLDPKDGNSKMAELAAQFGGKLGVCAVLDPMLGAENLPGTGDLIQRLTGFRPECLRIFPDNARTVFHPFYWEEILDAANMLGLPLIVDEDYTPEFFARIPEIAAQYPNVKFILIRYGLCRDRHVLPLLQKCRNIYFTIEHMLDNLQIEEIAEKAGTQKLLFGSGYPALPHAGVLGTAMYANITNQEREKILHKNWEGIRR